MGVSHHSHTKAGRWHILCHCPYTPVDQLSILWLLSTVPVFLFLPPVDDFLGFANLTAMPYALLNLVLVVFIIGLRTSLSIQIFDPLESPGLYAVHSTIADLYVILMFALISHEGSLMASLVWHGFFFDNDVQVVEHSAWSCQPSMELHQMLPSKYVGEYFMFTYLFWPLVLAVALFILRIMEPDDEPISVTSGVLLVTLFACVFVVVAFPVRGPRVSLMKLEPNALGVWASHVALFIEDIGFSSTVSLPSQRTALAVSLWLSCIHYNLLLTCVLLVFVPGMIVGTVYGGLNYTMDVIIGVFVASITYSLGSRLIMWMHQRTITQRERWHGGGCCTLDTYDLSHDKDLKFATEVDRLTSGEMFI